MVSHKILHDCIELRGGPCYEGTLIENFIEEYSKVYKGVREINRRFAKGYISSSIRKGFLKVVGE